MECQHEESHQEKIYEEYWNPSTGELDEREVVVNVCDRCDDTLEQDCES